jgi:hypothetical protein
LSHSSQLAIDKTDITNAVRSSAGENTLFLTLHLPLRRETLCSEGLEVSRLTFPVARRCACQISLTSVSRTALLYTLPLFATSFLLNYRFI